MKSLLASILLLISASLPICAQTTSYAPRDYSIIAPSPEVASAIKAIDVPIDYFKGIPDISLPIYTIKEGALSVPIVIQYQGGGIKVEEQEGNAGLGWTLRVGGVICRNVFGHPDEINRAGAKGLFNGTENDKQLREFARNTIADYDPVDLNYYITHRSIQQTCGVAYDEGRSDMANDIFKISCMGLSGTFIFNDSHNAVLSSPTPFKISPSHVISSYPPEFVVTDANGTEYFFNKQELTKYVYYYGLPENLFADSLNYTSAWHLTKIKNIHNDSIIFKYEQTGQRKRYSDYSETVYNIDNKELSAFKPRNVASRGQITYYPQKLTAIESTSVTVRFVYGAGNGNQITQIKVSVNDESYETIKEYSFGYKQYDNPRPDDLIMRSTQMLMNISENGKTKYAFSYYDSELPLDFYAQDFCGYYNGYIDNAGLSSAVAINRDVAPDVVMMGCLKSIVYPTGGKTEFIWEAHEYGSVRDIEVEEHSLSGTVTTVRIDTLVGLLEESGVRKLKITDYTISSGTFVYLDMTEYFNFNPQILMTTEYESSHVYDDGSGYIYNYPSVSFKSKSVQRPGYDQVFFLDKNTIETRYGGEPVKLQLPAGTYDVELHYPTDVDDAKEQIDREFRYADADCGRIYLTVAYSGSAGSSTVNKDYWGGVRISKIMSYTDDNATPVIKQYLYDSENPATSSGIAPALPDYKSHYYMTCPSQNTLGYENAVITGEHSHGLYNIPVGNVGVEYSSVMECYQMIDQTSGMPQNSHRINYRYSTQQSYDKQDYNRTEFRDYQPTGSQMWTSLAHRRGNLTIKRMEAHSSYKEQYSYEYNMYEKNELSEFTTDLFKVV